MTPSSLPTHWRQLPLADETIFAFETGIWTGEKPPLIECPVIRNTNFTSEGTLNLSNVAYILIEARQLDKKRLKWGDIIIERSGGGPQQPVGRVAFFNLADGAYCFSNFTSRLRVVDGFVVDPYYLHLYLFHFHVSGQTEALQRRTTGIRNLAFNDYKNSNIPLPPLPEQRAIAHALRTMQEAKEARRRELTLERERKAALMQHLFTHGTRGESLKETEIGMMPESWRMVSIGDAYNFTRKPTGLRYADYDAIPFVPMDHVPTGDLFFTRFSLRSLEELTSGTYFEPGDLLLAKITPSFENGKQGIIAELPTPFGIATTEVIPIQGIPQTSSNIFLAYYLLQSSIRAELASKMEGTTGRQRLSKSVLVNTLIPLPSLPEQIEIVEVFSAIDSKIASMTTEVETLDELFRAMLEELVTGRLSALPLVEDEDEIASVGATA